MNIIEAIILGLVEGITEFLPISSTAHLILTTKILGMEQTEFVSFFEVGIQSGAILAVVLLYWRYMLSHMKLLPYLIASFIPTAVIGLLMRDIVKEFFFDSTRIISAALIIFGIVFIAIEWFYKKRHVDLKKSIDKISYHDAILIGMFQGLAVVPGVSRAGAVIIGMIGLRYNRSESAQYSFLLAIPTILAASVFDFVKTDSAVFTPDNIVVLLIGWVTAFISAWFCIKWLISYLQKNTLTNFGIYRIVVGILALSLL